MSEQSEFDAFAYMRDALAPKKIDWFEELGFSLHPKQQFALDLMEGRGVPLVWKVLPGSPEHLPTFAVERPEGFESCYARVPLVPVEILFGGAAGGGKSHLLLVRFITLLLEHPGERALILRRVKPSLTRSLWPRAVEMTAGVARSNSNLLEIKFDNGSVLEFASLETEDEVSKFRAAEYAWIGFEELTEFTEYQYTYMLSRLRSPNPLVVCQVFSTTNPGGIGHAWVKERFVRPPVFDLEGFRVVPIGVVPEPGVVWFPEPNEIQRFPLARLFVPSTLDDNPSLDEAYADRIAVGSSRAVAKSLLRGDWDAIDQVQGALFAAEDLDSARVSPEHYPPSKGRFRRQITMIDPAVTSGERADLTGIVTVASWTLPEVFEQPDGGLFEADLDYAFVIADDTPPRCPPEEWARVAALAAQRHGSQEIGVECDQGGEMNRSILLSVMRRMVNEGELERVFPVRSVRASKLGTKMARASHASVLSRHGRIKIVGELPALEAQMTGWIPELTGPNKKSPDRLDAFVHAVLALGFSAEKVAREVTRSNRIRNKVSSALRPAPRARGLFR